LSGSRGREALLPARAVGRTAAARRHRALARGRARDLVSRRAVLRPRPADPARDAGRVPAPAATAEQDHRVHHPRLRRGHPARRPGRDHERGRSSRSGRRRTWWCARPPTMSPSSPAMSPAPRCCRPTRSWCRPKRRASSAARSRRTRGSSEIAGQVIGSEPPLCRRRQGWPRRGPDRARGRHRRAGVQRLTGMSVAAGTSVKPAPRPSPTLLWGALVLGAFALLWYLARHVPWLVSYPDDWIFPLRYWISDAMRWLVRDATLRPVHLPGTHPRLRLAARRAAPGLPAPVGARHRDPYGDISFTCRHSPGPACSGRSSSSPGGSATAGW
jgi:hypothetical protein